ncbi:MAG: PH domain-containing protein [Bellilinea sp.]
MSIEQYRARMKSAVWKAIANSGTNISSISSEQQATIVDAVADESLSVLNDILDDVYQKESGQPQVYGEETIIWQGRPFLSLVEAYVITSERIKVVKGLIGKDYENFELVRIQDIDVSQAIGERVMGLGDIHIRGADPSTPLLTLRNINNPNQVYELLRKGWLAARKRYGLIFREEM